MALNPDAAAAVTAEAPERSRPAPLVLAGMASLGAGAIHAAAIGVHSEHRSAVVAFTVIAALQVAWGALALTRGGRIVALTGALVSGAALVGWILAKTVGIGFVAGLDQAEDIQRADGAAALLAALALVGCGRALVGALLAGSLGPAPTRTRRLAPAPGLLHGVAAVVTAAVSVAAMVAAGSHSHAGGHGEEAAGHSHGGTGTEAAAHAHADGAEHADGEEHAAPVALPARPYDPTLPIDFSGVDGVSPEQQAAAENLVSITLIELPQFADATVAESQGWHSIGDGFTGHEHLINWNLIDDGRVLDPDYPESLVYDTSGGGRRLVSAMFMMPRGTSLDDVPELGGPLTQWHIHDNLCFSPGENPRVAGVTTVGGACQAPLQKFDPTPMIHVWIEPHVCGPFAALEGVAAGQVKPGEEQLCNHEHGAG